jgi:hypothetical protein
MNSLKLQASSSNTSHMSKEDESPKVAVQFTKHFRYEQPGAFLYMYVYMYICMSSLEAVLYMYVGMSNLELQVSSPCP